MRKKKEKDAEVYLGLRLIGAEALRYERVLEIAMERNEYATKTNIIRELLGLSPLKALKPEDVEYFRTGAKIKK